MTAHPRRHRGNSPHGLHFPLRHLIAGSAVLAAALLAGCSALGGTTTPKSEAPPLSQAQSSAAQAPVGSAPASAAPVSAPPSSDDLGQPFATRTVTIREFTVALDLYPLKVDGTFVTLNARLRVLKAPAEGGIAAPIALLGTGDPGALSTGTPNGLALVDSKAKLRHLPATDDKGRALCSPEIPSTWTAGDEIHLSCLFGAPTSPTVTVDAVTFGSIPDVPIT